MTVLGHNYYSAKQSGHNKLHIENSLRLVLAPNQTCQKCDSANNLVLVLWLASNLFNSLC